MPATFYRLLAIGVSASIIMFFTIHYLLNFNGLYGQDAHEYLRFTRLLEQWLLDGQKPQGSFHWTLGYPLMGAILAKFTGDSMVALQAISISASVTIGCCLWWLIGQIQPSSNVLTRWAFLILGYISAPYIFRNAPLVMSDLCATAFIMLAVVVFYIIKNKNNIQYSDYLFFIIFSALAILMRYASFLLLIPFLFLSIKSVFDARKALLLLAMTALGLLIMWPQYWIRGEAAPQFIQDSWLGDWSVLHFFQRSFHTLDGDIHNAYPNIIYGILNVIGPEYLLMGIFLILLCKKSDFQSTFSRVILSSVIIYKLLIMGIPTQSKRLLLMDFPLILLLLFPAFERLITGDWSRGSLAAWLLERVPFLHFFQQKYIIFLGLSLLLCSNLYFDVQLFRQFYQLNRLEQGFAKAIQKTSYTKVYAFDMAPALGTYLPKHQIINLYYTDISLKPNSLVLFNEARYRKQFSRLPPIAHWEHLQAHFQLDTVQRFEDGWGLFLIKDK